MTGRAQCDYHELPEASAATLSWGHCHTAVPHRLVILGIALVALLTLFWPTLSSLIAIWWRSETFAHGFLIFPISLFLIWRNRHKLAGIPVNTDLRALVALSVLGLLWVMATATDVLVVQQLAFVAMIPVLTWLLLGWRVTWAMAFPLGFLIFAVPMGEALIPPMMDFTAAFTVKALRLTGIPVYWEGTFFSIPSGNWSVVEGCSGVRYLIASMTLGFLYAHLIYRSLWRRMAFIALAVVFPIIANGLRAYMIVMIAHLSDMKLALGVDHFIYGWVFFGIVMFFLFWIGTLWREEDQDSSVQGESIYITETSTAEDRRRPLVALVAGVLVIAVWPVWAAYVNKGEYAKVAVGLRPPMDQGGWHRVATRITTWKPRFLNPTAEVRQAYSDGVHYAGLNLAYYANQRQGAELINSQNVMVEQKHPVWRQPYQREVTIRLNGEPFQVFEVQLKSAEQNLIVWYWYWVAGHHTVNPYTAKLREALAKLFGGGHDGAGIVVYSPVDEKPDETRTALQRYIDAMFPAIEASLLAARKKQE